MKNEILRLDHIQSSSLYNFNLSLFRNEILGLLVREDNERHAVIDILSGVVRPDAGYIFIDDVKTQIESKTHAGKQGLYFALKKSQLIQNMSIAENIFLNCRAFYNGFLVNKRRMQREAGVLLDSMGIYGIDPVEPASSLSEADGHKIELLKLLAAGARVIVIDNITGNYNDRELDGLIRIMLKLREKGIAVLFMTNKYNSMFRCANGAAVMRNGTVVFVDRGGKYTRDKIISIASAGEIYSPEIKKRGDTSRIVLEAAGVRSLKQPASQKSSFKLYKNEILGVCDDENENAADIVNSLLGNEKYTGSFFVDNREVKIRNFKTAVKNGIGVVSGDMINGVFYNMSIYDNITLMMPKKMYGVFGTINMRIKKFCLSQTVEKLDCRDLLESYGPANTIEGAGKVDRVRIATAKWVCAGMKIIVFINPYYSFDDLNIMMFEHLLERLRTIGISVLILSKRDAAMYRMCDRVLRVEDGVLNNI